MRQSCRPSCAEVERREIGRLELGEISLEQLMDMGSCALHDRLEAAEPHRDQFPNTGLSIRWKTAWKSDPALGVISIE